MLTCSNSGVVWDMGAVRVGETEKVERYQVEHLTICSDLSVISFEPVVMQGAG